MIPFRPRTEKVKSLFAEFIRNERPAEKKRVYSAVLTEATKRRNEIMVEVQQKRA